MFKPVQNAKFKDMLDILHESFRIAFEPGHALSLNETLSRGFGKTKFKVRVISKAASNGIKLYVVINK